MLRYALPLFAALALIGLAGATYVSVQGPVNANLTNNGFVYLGKVGPGESFYVLASATTTNASGAVVNIGWDRLEAVNLPSGWSMQASPLYENPMKLKVSVPYNISGTYNLTIRAVNVGNYSRLGNLTFTAQVDVTNNVFNVSVSPRNISAGVGQPVDINVKIVNIGIADEPFNISAQGLPAWNFSDDVIALHSRTSSFVYPVYVNEPGVYPFNLTITSATGHLVQNEYPINFSVVASLYNDYSAIGNGVVLSPVIFEPVYAIDYLLSYLMGNGNSNS
jgi:hypothetical protein